jgi:hypothetical protein
MGTDALELVTMVSGVRLHESERVEQRHRTRKWMYKDGGVARAVGMRCDQRVPVGPHPLEATA